MPSVWINDSMNYAGYVPGQAGQYPAVKFRYRVAKTAKRIAYYNAPTPEQQAEVGGQLICEFLQEMSALNDDGKTWERISMTMNEVGNLFPPIFNTVLNSILCVIGPSPEDEAPKSPAP